MSNLILIVEDEVRIANWLKTFLLGAGFSAEIAHDGQTGLELARSLNPDLIILDLGLPNIDGIDVCRTLRRESNVPIIILTSRQASRNRILGLESGADDYVIKPFDPEEVVARVKAVLRRVRDTVQQEITCGYITINETAQQVFVDGVVVNLSKKLFALLSVFMRHPDLTLTRDQLITLAFNDDFDGFDRTIDNQILRLRKAIAVNGKQPIHTIYGSGYKFSVEDNA